MRWSWARSTRPVDETSKSEREPVTRARRRTFPERLTAYSDRFPPIEAAVNQMLAVGQVQTLRDFRACDAFDASERLAALPVPLLAIAGASDALTPPKFAHFLADRVPVGSARIVDGAGHFAMVERPEETSALIRAFVARIDLR